MKTQITSADLLKFEPIVKKQARLAASDFGNSIKDADDFEQDFWWHITVQWDAIKEVEARAKSELEVFAYVKTMCTNNVKNSIAYYSRRPDTSEFAKFNEEIGLTEDSADLEDCEFTLNNASKFTNQEDDLLGKQLLKLIYNWAKNQDENVQLFIKESLSPSPELMEWWDEQRKATPRYRAYDTPPPLTLSRKLFNSNKFHYKVFSMLESFLQEHGYSWNKEFGYLY